MTDTTTTTEGTAPPTSPQGSEPSGTQTTPATPAAAPAAGGEGAPPATPATPKPGDPVPADRAPGNERPKEPPPTAAPAPRAPDTYATFTVPDGVGLGEKFITSFKTIAKELDLTQEGAQKLIDLAPILQEQNDLIIRDAVAATHKEWDETLKADSEIGGTKLTETNEVVNRVIDTYPQADALRTLLDESGFRGHPEVVRFIHWVGSKIVPDKKIVTGTPVGGDRAAGRQMTPQQRMAENYDPIPD